MKNFAKFAILASSAALALSACQVEEVTMEADAEDLSGGEFIVTPADAEGVKVNLPETPMTPATQEEIDAAAAAEAESEAAE